MPRKQAEQAQDFAETLNNIKGITLGQVFKIITKIKYSAALTLIAMFTSCIGGAFVAGQYSQQQETAVMLESPFAMRLTLDNKQHDFTNLTLIKDPMMPHVNDKVILSLREIKNDFDILPLGKIVATVEEKDISNIWKFILSEALLPSTAYAADPVFDWNGHKGDYKFKERFDKAYTVYRYYIDGCILSYNVDKDRRSIPSSFKWVEKTH